MNVFTNSLAIAATAPTVQYSLRRKLRERNIGAFRTTANCVTVPLARHCISIPGALVLSFMNNPV